MYDGMRSDAGLGSAMFFIVWIFIGNFALLNLFLAILLDKISASAANSNDTLATDEGESLPTFEKQVTTIIKEST